MSCYYREETEYFKRVQEIFTLSENKETDKKFDELLTFLMETRAWSSEVLIGQINKHIEFYKFFINVEKDNIEQLSSKFDHLTNEKEFKELFEKVINNLIFIYTNH